MIYKSRINILITCFFIAFIEIIPVGKGYAEEWQTMPIADVHLHVFNNPSDYIDAEFIIEKLKSNNIKWAGGVGDGGNKKIRKFLGERYISAFGQSDWTEVFMSGGNSALEDKNNFRNFFDKFNNGDYDGIGEIHINSLGKAPRDTPIDGAMMVEIYQFLQKRNGWIAIHTSAKRAPVGDLIKTINKYSKVKFILSHCLFDPATRVMRKIFEETKNSYCDISGNGPIAGKADKFRDREIIYGPSHGGLSASWKSLIEDFPDRVMIGTDTCCGVHENYDGIILNIRKYVLASLDEPVRSMVAYRNALAIFNLPER